MRQQLAVDEILGIVNDEHHNSFRNHVTGSFGDDAHVRFDKIAYRLYLALQLRIKGLSSWTTFASTLLWELGRIFMLNVYI